MKVLIADDHPVARRGLQMIVSEAFGDVQCAEATDGATALALAETLRPDLLLLDMHMPGELSAPALCRAMREALPDTKIVIVTAFDSSGEIRDCLLAGADGCLLKDTSETNMAAALHSTVTGTPALDPRIALQLARDLTSEPTRTAMPHLSRREQEVLRLLAQGRSNRAIARQLGLSEATIKGHVSRLLDKLGASSRLEAVVRATDAGLIRPQPLSSLPNRQAGRPKVADPRAAKRPPAADVSPRRFGREFGAVTEPVLTWRAAIRRTLFPRAVPSSPWTPSPSTCTPSPQRSATLRPRDQLTVSGIGSRLRSPGCGPHVTYSLTAVGRGSGAR